MLLLMFHEDKKQALEELRGVNKRIKDSVEKLNATLEVPISFSTGGHVCDPYGTPETEIWEADQKMYEAKGTRKRRNATPDDILTPSKSLLAISYSEDSERN